MDYVELILFVTSSLVQPRASHHRVHHRDPALFEFRQRKLSIEFINLFVFQETSSCPVFNINNMEVQSTHQKLTC
jgi:hypothetical protein